MARTRVQTQPKTGRYVCRLDKDGKPRVLRHSEVIPFRGEDTPITLKERVMKAYYAKECQDGARFRSGYKPSVVKKAWSNAA